MTAMATIHYYLGQKYRLTSKKNGGQFSGPCPFTGQGTDRFTVEPARNRWFCRGCQSDCSNGVIGRSGYRFGDMNEKGMKVMPYTPIIDDKPKKLTPEDAYKLAEALNSEGREYLYSRGLTDATIARFHLGMRGGNQISIPLMYEWKGATVCQAIKYRFLPQHQPPDMPKYIAEKGSNCKGVFNYDAMRKAASFLVIANSLFDVMLIDQLGYPVCGSYAGEASWEPEWIDLTKANWIINIGDWDEPDKKGVRPGEMYMLRRASMLSRKDMSITKVVNVFPPGGHTDVNAAWQHGQDIRAWLNCYLPDYQV